MANKQWIGATAFMVTLAALAWLYLSVYPRPPSPPLAPHRAVGELLGAQALQGLAPGARVFVLARDTSQFSVPVADAQLQGCLATLAKGGVKSPTLRRLRVDPLRIVGVPPGDFFELLKKNQPSDVIISFLGPPQISAEQLARLGDNRPRVLALCSGAMPQQVNLKALFDEKLLHAAAIHRLDAAAAGGSQPMFKLITLANLAELPGPADAP